MSMGVPGSRGFPKRPAYLLPALEAAALEHEGRSTCHQGSLRCMAMPFSAFRYAAGRCKVQAAKGSPRSGGLVRLMAS